MTVKLSKTKEKGGWRVLANKKPTPFLIERGVPAKWGANQMWDVVDTETDSYLFEAKSLDNAMSILNRLLIGLGVVA